MDIKIRPFPDRKEQLHLVFKASFQCIDFTPDLSVSRTRASYHWVAAAPLPPGYASFFTELSFLITFNLCIIFPPKDAPFEHSEVHSLVEMALLQYDADKIGIPDYALESAGNQL